MKQVEFFIVGQGLAGTLLAHEMWQNKIDFRIVTSPQKSKASMVAAGMINPVVFKRMTKSWMVDELLPVMKETYNELENILGERFFFEKDILKPLSEQEMLLWKERSVEPGLIKYIRSPNDKNGIEHIKTAVGYGRVTGSGFVHLSKFLHASEQYFRKKKMIIDSTFSFHNYNPEDINYTIEDITASKIVFCEGHHLSENPLFNFVKLKPVKGEILLVHVPELSEEYILNKKVFVLPVGNKRFKVGSTYDWEDLSEQITEKGKSSITERLENLIKTDYAIEYHWAGIRPTVIDRRPVLGYHPKFKNLSVFNGLGTKGVMLAPSFAKETLKFLTNRNYSILKDVDLNRFN